MKSRAGRAARTAKVSPVMKGGMPRALGVRILSLTRKKVIGELPIKPMHLNETGKVNGGAIMAFADVLGAAGAVANRPPRHRGGTIESKTNFFAAGQGPVLSAVSIPLHIGRTTTVWQTTIRNPDGRAVAIVTQTQIMIPDEPKFSPGARKPRASRGK
ncbi:MAG: PaaI family thioesterase [Burkholderiales bacterium]|nr:PaaI family thioesterase [Burkholderiales bacterium]